MIPEKKTLKDEYKKAPEAIQKFIVSKELGDIFNEIRTEYKIHLDQAEKLGLAINSVILGISDIEHFPSLLREALPDSSEEVRGNILGKINENVFTFLRQQLKNKPSIDAAEELLNETGITQTPASSVRDKLNSPTTTSANEVEVKTEEVPKQTSEYRSGTDPYKEPIE